LSKIDKQEEDINDFAGAFIKQEKVQFEKKAVVVKGEDKQEEDTNDSIGAFIKQEKAQSEKKEKKASVVKEEDKQEEDTIAQLDKDIVNLFELYIYVCV
jgi:hypothetical protein